MRAIETAARRLSAALAAVAAAILTLMMVLTFVDVAGRFALNRPLFFTIELTQLLMGLIVFLGLALTTLRRGHVTVDVVVTLLPPPFRRIADLIANLCAVGVLGLLTWLLLDRVFTNIADGLRTQLLYLPVFPFALVMAVGAGAACLIALWNLADQRDRPNS
jgi:TRAP-type C4-dicarboxylate transport system permease small subunit